MHTHHIRLAALRAVVSLLAAFHININGHWELIPKAIVTPMFYAAFLISFGTSFLILFVIHYFNNELEQKYPWNSVFLRRTFFQIAYCIIVPALIDFLIILFYFAITGKLNFISSFLKYEFPTVLLFIVAVNIVHMILSFLSRTEATTAKPKLFSIKHNGAEVVLNPVTDILYIYKDGRNVKVVTISGHHYTSKDTIANISSTYRSSNFCQVNPSAIINLLMLKGYATGTRSKTLEPLFKPQFQDRVSQGNLEKLRVTREYLPNFKKEMKKYMAGEVQI